MTPTQYPAWFRRRVRGAPDPDVMERLATAMSPVDENAIRRVLRSDAVLVIDSGRAAAAPTPVHGPVAGAAALNALMTRGTVVTPASINGTSGLVLSRDEAVVAAVTAELRAGLLSRVWVVCNPEKLRHWNRG